jgi:hypothetical protein
MKKEYELSLKLYSKEVLKQAIKDFEEVSLIKIKGTKLIVEWDTSSEIEEVFNEFMNYVIWLIND